MWSDNRRFQHAAFTVRNSRSYDSPAQHGLSGRRFPLLLCIVRLDCVSSRSLSYVSCQCALLDFQCARPCGSPICASQVFPSCCFASAHTPEFRIQHHSHTITEGNSETICAQGTAKVRLPLAASGPHFKAQLANCSPASRRLLAGFSLTGCSRHTYRIRNTIILFLNRK